MHVHTHVFDRYRAPRACFEKLVCSAATEADEERAPEKERKRKDSWMHQSLLVSSCYMLFRPSSQLVFYAKMGHPDTDAKIV